MELFDLHDKVAIVTGGNGGIGLGIAHGLAQAGADIVVAARNPDKTREAVEQLTGLGVRAMGLQVDVTDAARRSSAWWRTRPTLSAASTSWSLMRA